MNFGFNSNVRAGEILYHVQTEDRGPSRPYLDTVVYQSGRVVYKRSTSYQDFKNTAKAEDLPQQLHGRLAQQHREVIAELEAGTLPLNAPAKSNPQPLPGAADAEDDGLDVRLKNQSAWFASGMATLEIELRRRNSKEEIGNADVEAFLEHGKERTPCARTRGDASGQAILKFPMPATASDGASLVIRATDGSLYGELRFRLKAIPLSSVPAPVLK